MSIKQAGAAISIVAGSLGIWGGAQKVLDYLLEERILRRVTIERINNLQERVCELEGNRWFRGECVKRRRR